MCVHLNAKILARREANRGLPDRHIHAVRFCTSKLLAAGRKP